MDLGVFFILYGIGFLAVVGVAALIKERFPTVTDRSKRYIKPKRKGVKR